MGKDKESKGDPRATWAVGPDVTTKVSFLPPPGSSTFLALLGPPLPSSNFPNAAIEISFLPPDSSILFAVLNPSYSLTSLTDASRKTPLPSQSTSITSKYLLEDNALLENIARNAFGLLSKKKKLPLVKKDSRTIQKAGNYITTLHKRKRTRSNGKTRKRKSHTKIFSMASPNPNKNKPDCADEVKSELRNEFEKMNSPKMCGILISPLCVFPYPSSSSEITNTLTLRLPDIHLSFDLEILSWSINLGVQVFKIDPMVDCNCSCSPALLRLDGWFKSVSF